MTTRFNRHLPPTRRLFREVDLHRWADRAVLALGAVCLFLAWFGLI